jgi:hypothetical protein
MFVVTSDQRSSRTSADRVPDALATVMRAGGARLALAPERTAGDEIQFATADAAAVLATVLALTRTEAWSVGVGVGDVEHPLPDSVRAGRGSAFVRAREAVDKAKRASTRVAIIGDDAAADAEALVRLLIEVRDRRSDEGWEVHDLLAGGITQREAASRLGITESAVSLRVKAAGLRAEAAAIPALERVLARLDEPQGDVSS